MQRLQLLCALFIVTVIINNNQQACARESMGHPTWSSAWTAFRMACKANDQKILGSLVTGIGESKKGMDWKGLGRRLDKLFVKQAVLSSDRARVTLHLAHSGTGAELGKNNALRMVKTKSGWKVDLSPPPSFSASAVKAQLVFIVEAQRMFRRADLDKDGLKDFAGSLRGADSLFERFPGKGDLRLISERIAYAEAGKSGGRPYMGYWFRVLPSRGPVPKGVKSARASEQGAKEGKTDLKKGFGIIAYPANYSAGARCFAVGSDGVLYEVDLGKNTAQRARKMAALDPDPKEGWQKTSP